MQLQHRFSVAAPVDVTWAAFNELDKVAPCFPGAVLTAVDGDEFSGTCTVKLGPISMQYSGSGRFLERDEATHRAVIEAKGRDKRGNGTAGASVTAQLRADGEATLVDVKTELSITGKPAQFGRGVMQDVSDRLLAQFVDCLQERLAPEAAAAQPDAAQPDAAQPHATQPDATQPDATQPAAAQPFKRPAEPAESTSTAEPPRPDPADGGEQLDLLRIVAPTVLRRFAPPVLGLGLLVLLVRRLRRTDRGADPT